MFFKLMVLLSVGVSVLMGSIQSPFVLCLLVIMMVGMSCGVVGGVSSLWMSYALLIVFLGGMMVLFSYASSMSVSDKLVKKGNYSISLFMVLLGLFLSLPQLQTLGVSGLYLKGGLMMLFLCTFYLLLSLFLSVKMVDMGKGALLS